MRTDDRTTDPSLITVHAHGSGETVGDALAEACAKAGEAWGDEPWITVRQTRHGSGEDSWRVHLETVAARLRHKACGYELRPGDLIVSLADGSPVSGTVTGKVILDELDLGTYHLGDDVRWTPDPAAEFIVLRPRPAA